MPRLLLVLAALAAAPALADPSPAQELATNASNLLGSDPRLAGLFAAKALRLDPAEPLALEVLVQSCRRRRAHDDAQRYADRLVKARPDASSRLLRAEVALDQRRSQEALDALAPLAASPLEPALAKRRDALTAHAKAGLGEQPARAVVVYGASWCGYCRSVREWLDSRRIPFTDVDIERDRAGNDDLTRKARDFGINRGTIPITDVDGDLVVGFDEDKLARVLR